ncbi:MAG: magnesium transporter [Cytophagaceae bacterium]|nr:magnesium transporter [Cytophagaceae bacterium]MDW8456393.1 magnesium transporter [Cytophagaceae bacterium]
MPFELTQDFIDQIKQAISDGNDEFVKNRMEELLPQDIASVMYELDIEESKYIFTHFDKKLRADIISELDESYRVEFLEHFTPDEIAQYITLLDSDDAADILSEQENQEEIIEILEDQNEEKAKDIKDLLHYDYDTAGGLMQKELIRANLNWTIEKCVEEMRIQAKKVGKIYSVYVVDNNEKLLGRVSVKKMLLSDDGTRISDIYDPDVISVDAFMPATEVADLMKKYDLVAVPVVNNQGKLIGRITIDDVVDVITEKAEMDMQAMSGLSAQVEEEDSVWDLTKARLPWLMIGMCGGILGAQFLGLFENFISLIPAMAFFIPLITATGGNVGIQSSSLIVQSLARDPSFDEFSLYRLGKGFLVAFINAIAIAGLVLIVNMILGESLKLTFVVSIALFSVVILASLMGTVTPLILNRFGINPAVASGPFITTMNDLLGLAVYFLVAYTLFKI